MSREPSPEFAVEVAEQYEQMMMLLGDEELVQLAKWKLEGFTNEEIAKFCSSKYSVTFPMLGKVSVKGKDQTPLYAFLTSKETNPKYAGEIGWNFEKFLVNKKGEVVGKFKPGVAPESDELTKAIVAELDAK